MPKEFSESNLISKELDGIDEGDKIDVKTKSETFNKIEYKRKEVKSGDDGAEVVSYYFDNGTQIRLELLKNPDGDVEIIQLQDKEGKRKDEVKSVEL